MNVFAAVICLERAKVPFFGYDVNSLFNLGKFERRKMSVFSQVLRNYGTYFLPSPNCSVAKEIPRT